MNGRLAPVKIETNYPRVDTQSRRRLRVCSQLSRRAEILTTGSSSTTSTEDSSMPPAVAPWAELDGARQSIKNLGLILTID
jgi:hypothetical protein